MKYLLTLCFLFFICLNAFGESVFEHPVKLNAVKLPTFEKVDLKFEREMILKNAKKPVLSGGNFTFDPKEGVCFETTYPVKSKVVYSDKHGINEIISALAKKQYHKLEKEFYFYHLNFDTALRPKKNSNAYGILSYIIVTGKERPEKITVEMTNGNKTIIRFFDK